MMTADWLLEVQDLFGLVYVKSLQNCFDKLQIQDPSIQHNLKFQSRNAAVVEARGVSYFCLWDKQLQCFNQQGWQKNTFVYMAEQPT